MEKKQFKAKTLRLKSVIANIIDSNKMVAGRKPVKKGSTTAAKLKKLAKGKKSATSADEHVTVVQMLQ